MAKLDNTSNQIFTVALQNSDGSALSGPVTIGVSFNIAISNLTSDYKITEAIVYFGKKKVKDVSINILPGVTHSVGVIYTDETTSDNYQVVVRGFNTTSGNKYWARLESSASTSFSITKTSAVYYADITSAYSTQPRPPYACAALDTFETNSLKYMWDFTNGSYIYEDINNENNIVITSSLKNNIAALESMPFVFKTRYNRATADEVFAFSIGYGTVYMTDWDKEIITWSYANQTFSHVKYDSTLHTYTTIDEISYPNTGIPKNFDCDDVVNNKFIDVVVTGDSHNKITVAFTYRGATYTVLTTTKTNPSPLTQMSVGNYNTHTMINNMVGGLGYLYLTIPQGGVGFIDTAIRGGLNNPFSYEEVISMMNTSTNYFNTYYLSGYRQILAETNTISSKVPSVITSWNAASSGNWIIEFVSNTTKSASVDFGNTILKNGIIYSNEDNVYHTFNDLYDMYVSLVNPPIYTPAQHKYDSSNSNEIIVPSAYIKGSTIIINSTPGAP